MPRILITCGISDPFFQLWAIGPFCRKAGCGVCLRVKIRIYESQPIILHTFDQRFGRKYISNVKSID